MRIHKEGYSIIATSAVAIAAVVGFFIIFGPLWLGVLMSVIGVGLFVFIVSFFREPKRERLVDDELIFSPCDGKVVVVEVVQENEYFKEPRLQISIFMSMLNVHVNWFPVGGRVVKCVYHPGKYMVAWHPKSSEENERTTTVVDTGRCEVLFRQIAGLVARRIVSYAREGVDAPQNEQCGFIKFGSRVDIFLPVDTKVLVQLGQKVVGSQTPIAKFE